MSNTNTARRQIAYVNREGRVGLCCDEELIALYWYEYTSMLATSADTGFVMKGFVPRPLLVAVQVRRMMREQEAA